MDLPDLSEQLEQLRSRGDRLRAVAAEATPLRIRHELQHTTDEPLRQLLLRAQRGEVTLLEVLGSADYQRVHGQAYDDAFAEYQRAHDAGELPELDEADGDLADALVAGVEQLRSDVERVEAERAAAAKEGEQEVFVYRPRISDR